MSSSVAGPSRSSSLPLRVPSSPRLVLHRTRRLSLPASSAASPFTYHAPTISRPRPVRAAPMDYFSLPLPLHDDSALADSDSESEYDDSEHEALSTTSSQASFYEHSFNYENYRTGLQLPTRQSQLSPSFGFDATGSATTTEAEVSHLEFASSSSAAAQLSPTSTVGSDYTLADSFDIPSFHHHSPPSSCSSFSSGHQPITPPKYEISLPAVGGVTRPRRMAFDRYVPTPNLKLKHVHVDTPYPEDEEEEEDEPRGRGLERRELMSQSGGQVVEGGGFELVLGLTGTLAARRGVRA